MRIFEADGIEIQDQVVAAVALAVQEAESAIGEAGIMSPSVYDPTLVEGDVFDRANHTGTQASSTISGLDIPQPNGYTPTNVSTDRTYDANATDVNELADVLGTLIADLQAAGILS